MKAVFLDRDGTIAKDVHYCRRVEDFEILPTVPEAIKLLNENGFKVIVVTNQSGIARGYFTEETLSKIHQKMINELSKHGAHIDAIYYCPHHPDDGCDCRKPKTALFHKAAKEHNIDFSASYVVGDRQMDIDAGRALGCRTILVNTGPEDKGEIIDPPDYTADNLLQAAKWIIEDIERLNVEHRTSNIERNNQTITILIPALNEKDGIAKTIHSIPKSELEKIGYNVQILVVDNGSNDGTAELARKAGAEVVFEPRRGYGRAFKAGFAHAKGDIIVTTDADLTYPVEDIPRLLKIFMKENLDFLTTNRFALLEKGAMSFRNKLGNKVLSLAVRFLFQLNLRDPESGMWVFKRSLLDKLKLSSDIWPFSHEIKLEACYFNKHRWKEVPISYRPRVGNTKLLSGWKVGFTDLFHIIKKRFSR